MNPCVSQCVVVRVTVYVAVCAVVINLMAAVCTFPPALRNIPNGDQGGVSESKVRHISVQIEICICANSSTPANRRRRSMICVEGMQRREFLGDYWIWADLAFIYTQNSD